MKLAIPFKLYFPLNESAHEFNIKFDPEENDFDKLELFIEDCIKDNKRVNIEYKKEVDLKTAKLLNRLYDNVYFRLSTRHLLKIKDFQAANLRFFFQDMPCINWIELKNQVEKYGVTDVYICDDLVYDMDNVKKYCSSLGVQLRIVLNRIPLVYSTMFEETIVPIYRPNDYELLSKYYDVAEFDCGNPYQFNKLNVLYKAWFLNKDWYGNLQEINEDLTFSLPNRGLVEKATLYKLTCGLKCIKYNNCQKCSRVINIANLLKDMNAQVKMGETK